MQDSRLCLKYSYNAFIMDSKFTWPKIYDPNELSVSTHVIKHPDTNCHLPPVALIQVIRYGRLDILFKTHGLLN